MKNRKFRCPCIECVMTGHTHTTVEISTDLLYVSPVHSAIWTIEDEDSRSCVIHSLLNRLVQKRRHIFLLITMSCAENHHTILDRERVQMIEHHMVGFWQQGRIT